MGTFNFSNMQQQEDKMRNVPEEFRGAVEKAASEPVGSYSNNDDNEIDTNTGFLDETGTWNNGKGQDLQKYNPTQKQFNNSAAGQMFNSNAYKKYFYSREDVLQEAKTISAATHIPENAILSNADNLKNARDIYNYQQRAMDPQAVFKAYPELGELAQKSDTDAAIALHNLKNVRQTQGIVEAAKTGWELDSLTSERGRIGYAALNGKELSEADLKRLEEIKKQQEQAKELPTIFEDPLGAVVGGTVQSGKMMLRNMLSGQKMGVYGAGFGAIAGGLIGGGATLGAGTAAGMAAGAKIGWSIGSRIGMAQDMYDEIAGNNYLDYKNYKDKHGKQLLTDNQARAYAAAAAAVETGIEFTNADKILGIVKGGAGAQSLKNIIASAKDSTELQSLLAAYVRNGMKNIGEVTLSESAEEGVQEMSNRVITNIAASNNPGGDIPTYSAEDVIMGGLEASWQALPTSLGFGASAHAGSTIGYARRMAAAMEIKSEEDKANLRTANGLSLLRSLGEDLETNELFKKSPEIYHDVLKSQLKGTDLETVHIDTEMVLNQEGGYELLKDVADKAGVSEEQFNNIVETKADLRIDVADYAEKVLKHDIGAKLEEYITFDDIGECLARNRQYASRMRREMDKILAFEERQREDALNTFLDQNFPDAAQREVAEAVIRRFPDNPKEGVKVIRQSLQDKIDTPLKEIIEQLKEGAGKGVSIHAVDENGNLTSWENSDHGKGVRVSNNAPWYQKWYKEYGHKPSEKEYRELARDIYTGHNPYGLEGWENRSAEENQWYEDNKAAMEATEQAIARLDALTPALEKIDPGELTITEGLSEEAFEVYREMRKKLFEGAGGEKLKKKAREKARQEAQMNAILFARMADRMAEWHQKAGQTKYTAKNFARSVGVEFGGKAGGERYNQPVTNPGLSLTSSVPIINIKRRFSGKTFRDIRNNFFKDYPELVKSILTDPDNKQVHKPYINEVSGAGVIVSKDSIKHILSDETSTTIKNPDERALRQDVDRYELLNSIPELIEKGVMVEEHEDIHGKAERIYRIFAPVSIDNEPYFVAKLTLKREKKFYKLLDGDIVKNKLYDASIAIKKEPGQQPQDSAAKAGPHAGSSESSSNVILADMLEGVKDNNGVPYIGSDGELNVNYELNTETFNQKAYREKQSDAKIIYPSDFSPYMNNQSYRCTNSSKVMSDYGYAMFGDNAAWVDGYGENLYSVFHDDLEDINNLKKKIAEAWDEDVEMETIPADLEVLARERTGEQIAEDFDPTDIVDGAGAWDIPELASWAFERGVFEDIPGVKTRDGAVVWDDSIIHKGDKDADVWGEDAEKNRVGAENYNQSAGERAMTANVDAGQKGLYKIKGQTAFKANGKKVIYLFKAADQSTFMHEMAHIYLHDMLELAKLPNAPKQLLDDMKTLSEWASWRPETFDKEYKGTALEREFRKMHEQIADAQKFGYLKIDGRDVTLEQLKLQWAQERFARGFENYLREGKAPAEAVRTVFQRFKKWLSDIYRAFVQIGGTPSKEVRAVMDRMIASEDEIDIAMTKKGVDDFTEKGGMDYLADNAKQVYNRMVERAKEDAKEKVLKIALKDVKEDYRQQEKEFFEQEEKDYREKLEREPVFVIQEHIKNNPDMSTSAICRTLGMSVEDYVAKLKEYGGSIDAAVQAHMKEFKKNIDNSGFDAQYFREKAEEIVQESKYRKLVATMELNAFEKIVRAQRSINKQAVSSMTLTKDEKGVMGTVDKLTAQSKKIEQLKAEKKEGIAKERQAKEQIIANVRGLRDAALKHYQEFGEYVEKKLEVMPIEEANNYQMWRRKSAEAQHNSERAIVSGKWELAVKYKRAQVIYDMFADRAVRNDKKIKKIEEQLTKRRQTIIKNKNISANERYAYNHMLYVFGFVDADAPMPPKYQEENGFMGVLQKSDAPREVDGLFLECPFFTPEGFLNLPEWLVSAAMGTQQREQGHKDLSNEQVKMLAQVMNIIYKRGVDDMKLHTIESVDGKSLTVDDVIAEIEGQVNQHIVAKTIKDTTGATKKTWDEEAARAINDSNQFLIKPEVILKKLGSVSLKYIYEPLKLAADKELRMAHDMQKKMETLFKRYTPEELDEIRNKQRYKFGTSVLTKEQVIMIALNWGTEINAKRVMDGYHVSEYDVRKVLAELTEKDWNLINDVWKLYDEHWDEVREIEARITGAVLEKQPNRAFTIIGSDEKSYTLEGGYFPIKYDPSEMRTQEQKADAAAMQQTAMSNISMSLGKGFLKERSNAKIERRLDLRFDVISRSVADVIHLVAFREPVRDVRHIVLRDDFKNIVTRFLGDAEYKQLKKWTADCWAEEPLAQSKFETFAAKLRNAQTMGMMGFRVVTAALNIANAPIVAHYMGTVDMLHALKKFYSAPRQYADFIFQRSVFMAERAETMDANIRDAIKGPHFMDGVPVVGKAKELLRENAFKMLTWTDLVLAMPLWQHEYEKAYNKELEAGHTPQQAQMTGISAGDAAVRWCFGSGRTVDKAAVQRQSGEFMKQLTMYYSYMSTVYNAMNYQQWEARMGYKKAMQWADANKSKELLKAVTKMGGWLFAWQLMPAIITALFKAATSGDDDDLKAEKLLKSIGKETLSTLVGGIPVLRDAVPYLLAKAFDEKQFAPKIPVQNTIEQTNRVIQSIVNDKKSFTDVLRESGKLISQTTGAPSTLVDALTTSITYLETGFDASVADYLRALILDKKLKKDKK